MEQLVHHAWELFKELVEGIEALIEHTHAFEILVVVAPTVLFWLFSSTRFLARFRFGEYPFGLGYLAALWKLREIPFFALFGRAMIGARTARLLVELEILSPPDPKPTRYDFGSKQKYRVAHRAWKEKRREWRMETQKTLKELIEKIEDGDSSTEPVIALNNPGGMDERRDAIRRYFEVVRPMGDKGKRFIARVEIRNGFIAPLFLVSGILSRFEDDWKLVIDNYREQLTTPLEYSQALNELRSFQFNCWLLWGPSIPMCQCLYWHKDRKNETPPPPLAYQYGFGDENNSIDLLTNGWKSSAFQDSMRGLFLGVYAAPYVINAQVEWGPNFASNRICEAQQLIRGGSEEHYDENRGRVVLRLRDPDEDTDAQPKHSHYYSAYIWIMFLILDGKKQAPYFGDDRSWCNLLPFFEHGNIADAQTFLTLKRVLVAKIVAALQQTFSDPRNADVRLSVACAFDQSLCGEPDGVMYPTPPAESLIGLLRAELQSQPAIAARVQLPPSHSESSYKIMVSTAQYQGPVFPYAACHVPEHVEKFYHRLAELAATE